MLFKDRKDAGVQLSEKLLKKYKNNKDALVLALPRGGIVVGDVIAKNLNLKLDLIIPRKIPSPISEELAIGAVCEDSVYLNKELVEDFNISDEYLENQINEQKNKIQQRKKIYKKYFENLLIKNKIILLVDDGIATGATMFAAILALKKKKPKKIVVCIPVGPSFTLDALKKSVDELVCLCEPEAFYAISQYYENFDQVTDEEVLTILRS